MADFVRNENGDLAICNGDLEINNDGTSVTQAVKERLRSFAGEWFLDSEGLPYLTDIWGKTANYRTIHALLLETVTQTEGVAVVTKFDLTLNTETRQLSLICEFQSIFNSAERFEGCIDINNAIEDLVGDAITDIDSDKLRDLS